MRRAFFSAIIASPLLLSASASADLSLLSKNGKAIEPVSALSNSVEQSSAIVELGQMLFYSRNLSRDGSRNCASCHDLSTNGADALKVGVTFSGSPLPHNAPTVFNAALNFRLNWEGNVRTLQDQASRLLQDPNVMNNTWGDLEKRLKSDPQISVRFHKVFGRPVDRRGILDGIAAFEWTLMTPDSRFDLWLKGDEASLTATEKDGYNLFKSVGCVSCHQGANFGGNLFQRVGVFEALFKDQGPKRLRVPSLRNVAVTAPYFDDGSAATLDEAVRRMADAQLGRRLTKDQIESIVAFLQTLTGRFRGALLRQAQ